jgi:hypothetical protein
MGQELSRSATCTSQTRDEVPCGAFFLFVSEGFSDAIRPSSKSRRILKWTPFQMLAGNVLRRS